MERTSFSEKVAKDLIDSIAISHYWMFQPDNEPLEWDTTTCQDVVHSIYKTQKKVRKRISKYSHGLDSDEWVVACRLVARVLRPFAIKWHGVFFENDSCWSDGELSTTPRNRVSKKLREEFRRDFKGDLRSGILNAIEVLQPEIDVMNKVAH